MKKVIPIGLASVVTLTSAAAFFGDLWWALDLVANFRVQLAAISFVVLVLVAIWQSLPAAAIAAVGLLVNAAVILPLYATPFDSARTTLTVASFNLLSSNENHDGVIEWIREADADVVFLHEGTEAWEDALHGAGLTYDIVTTREPHFAFGTIALVPPGSVVTDHGFARTEHRAVEVEEDLSLARIADPGDRHPPLGTCHCRRRRPTKRPTAVGCRESTEPRGGGDRHR